MMRTLFNNTLVLMIMFLVASCSSSDGVEELSGGYFLRMEGKDLNDILCSHADGKEIPSNVLTYNSNEDFIIASQKPRATDDPLYTPVVYYNGRDSIYYWLIVHSKKLTLGPMSKHDFDVARQRYNVPSALVLKPLDWQ
ncbi:MAG: hypothetical protein IPP34_21495 [Bacteroidetes bacterium]|nr:hypothetical protein [Bacteroidota bacterium]MBK8415456.1 hypothetical protein [Bacteroidota bacterium]MBL0074222.1 hypothetical protein [Bacteroidota bacterium]